MTVGSKTATYAYDADGIRTQKTVDGVTHTYYTLNGKLMRESFPYRRSQVHSMRSRDDFAGRRGGHLPRSEKRDNGIV